MAVVSMDDCIAGKGRKVLVGCTRLLIVISTSAVGKPYVLANQGRSIDNYEYNKSLLVQVCHSNNGQTKTNEIMLLLAAL